MSDHAPLLLLDPLNNTFESKIIPLPPGTSVQLGRKSNAATIPSTDNGCFDSQVMSRRHAEVWEQDGKIWIRDTKSSNGTYVNSKRLSPEGVESEPCELRTGDVIRLGVDVIEDDSILFSKLEAHVSCIFPPPPPGVLLFGAAVDSPLQVRERSTNFRQATGITQSGQRAESESPEYVLHLVYI